MALTWLLLTALTSIFLKNGLTSTTLPNGKSMVDTKRRNEVVDEAFIEQKDILLDMLESKLKEVRDKKKKKSERLDSTNNIEGTKCDSLPNNVDLKLKSSGLSALGETDLQLKFGNSGKGTLNLDATGISNVGKARLDLAVGDGGVYLPGLNHLFVGKLNNCDKQNETGTTVKENPTRNLDSDFLEYRRAPNVNKDNLPNNDEANKEVNKDDQNKTEPNNVNNTTLDGNNTTAVDIKAGNLSSTVAVENNTVDLGNATAKP
ncbi:hypothetical protein ABMA27_014900 [Loxostege sticticalis]|uniref:Uncharacterized protein n=1 Tax=Loxostege sticticalis TaxID=481309 RepID=A0ABR3IAL7_LOXSC